MSDPDFVELIVGKRNNGETIRANPCLFQSQSYHRNSFSGREWIVQGVAVLGTAHDNYQLIDSFKNILHRLQMAQVEWLESTNVEAGGQLIAFGWIPKSC